LAPAEGSSKHKKYFKKKNMHLESYLCVLCQSATEEALEHLFLDCQFARNCWNSINIVLQGHLDILTAVDQIRAHKPNLLHADSDLNVLGYLDNEK
jgi:hypothetical protein